MIHPPRRGAPRWIWIVLVAVALVIGTAAGLWVGLERGETGGDSVQGNTMRERTVSKKLAEARVAVGDGDWFEARRLFLEVKEIDPENPEALASLPLIDRHLDEARGSLRITTEPEGAHVVVAGVGEFTSPVTVPNLPLGQHRLRISMEGYETVERNVEIDEIAPRELDLVTLQRTAGRLEVVSEPKGAEFRLLRTVENEEKELVEVGNTPAMIEQLDPGEYEVFLAVEGWPEYSEMVRVENNRNTSVSAVFAKGGITVTSDPVGAGVWIRSEGESEFREVGPTPRNLDDLPVGTHVLELRYRDWSPIRRTVEVAEGVTEELDFAWERALVSFDSDPSGATVFLDSRRLGDGRQVTPFQVELPEGDYFFTALHPVLGNMTQSAYVDPDAGTNDIVFRFSYGSVNLTSEPSGVGVLSGGKPIGRTPLRLPVVPPGTHTYELVKQNYSSATVSGKLEPGGQLDFSATLKYSPSPKASHSFKNGIGQQLVWIGELRGWVAAHETTQAEYERLSGENPSYFKAPNHPVETVTWYDAVKFCEALTLQEQGLGNIPAGYRYRLPTDAEWSVFVGQQKLDGAISSLFDRKKSTAPVGSLAPNEFGLFDVRGNVWEWVSDWYSQTIVNRVRAENATPNPEWVGTDRKVLRGGAWNRSSQFDLAVANRMAARPSAEDRYDVGFRVVLMRN